ncbi:MAG: Tyrosine type site-specific recombinase [Candidatus Woesebacteria bacterium GW2011_GWB1_38_8]|uniref:Tyrosine type site-specific recombinase n=1 Tax=Candidatus Woesebacteria bacterium GW2011_GWB1_38_8 TaxID=1618570 RepID=A0A0G0L1J4_9BACT|nr:MAG: Tyrosine type site-specific recombinase [Candidatus Woesebacteria bacterium GW2011_GWB1_38_8]
MKIVNVSWEQLQSFLLNDRKHSDKPSAVYAVKSRFKTLKTWFGDKEFNRDNFNLFIQHMRESGYSVSYRNNFIKLAKTLGIYLKTDEFRDYLYFRENRTFTGEVLTPDEIQRIAEAGPDPKYNALLLLMGTTGARIGEILSLVQEDVRGTPAFVIFRNTKNGSDRMVPISENLYKQLKNLGNGRVFSMKNSQWVNIELKRRAKSVGITKRVFCHQFRHSYITTMREQGVEIADIATIVGHQDPRNTMRYSHASLSYFTQVVRQHPLLKDERSWEESVKLLRKKVGQLFEASQVEMAENGQEFVLKVRNY